MVNLGVMVLELDSSFGGCFSLELGGMEEWTSCGVVSMADVIGGVFWERVPWLVTCLG